MAKYLILRFFPLFGGMIGDEIFFSYFKCFMLKTLFQALHLEIKPLQSTMGV
jgi:hypothetical protein